MLPKFLAHLLHLLSHSSLEQPDLKANHKTKIWLNPTNSHGYLAEGEKSKKDIWKWKPFHSSLKLLTLDVQWTIK